MKVIVLGVSGMLGNAVFRVFSESPEHVVIGTARNGAARKHFTPALAQNIVTGVDVENFDSLTKLFATTKPDLVINCVGLIKQLAEANDPLQAIPINSMLPHRLANLCAVADARLVHVSTDCVFSGAKGGYLEIDPSDAKDLYGRSKFLGEVDYPNAITLRTSIIGHELNSANALIGWFLEQAGPIRGFSRAIFSGFPTVELAYIIRDYVAPQPLLTGLYHVSAAPIDKFSLLSLVAEIYGKEIDIVKDDSFVIDRSLNSQRFQVASGYTPPDWPSLVKKMFLFK